MRSPTRRPLWPGRSSSSLAPIDGRTGNASLLKTLGVTTVAVKVAGATHEEVVAVLVTTVVVVSVVTMWLRAPEVLGANAASPL